MASRVNISRVNLTELIRSRFVRDLPLVVAGCAIAALAVDIFMVPNGLAAGGLTGLATILSELARRNGFYLPVGLQTIVFNIVLLLFVMRTGGVRYAVRTITGFVLFGFFTDLFVPLAETFADAANDLMLSAPVMLCTSKLKCAFATAQSGKTRADRMSCSVIVRIPMKCLVSRTPICDAVFIT